MMPYASSSSSTRTQSHGYDVFLSFRGEDTRTGFTSHLYEALTGKNITTYKDDKTLETGSFIAPELLAAIETSRFAVVVLSNNFATSKWCLVEIAKAVDCLEQGKLIVIPVFYHVSPSDMSRQSGCFKQGFANHEANPKITPHNVETWRSAFAKLGKISGFHVTKQSNEAEVVNDIVKRILKDQLQYMLPTDLTNGLVGIKSRGDEVKRILRLDSSEVLFIGICGMSGIGKTTLAEAVYKEIRYKFDRSSFIENIKDISKQNDSTDLSKLQQKLLHDLLKDESIRVQNVSDGQTLLGTKLRGLKVMIVLDDVNHADQLTYLAGGREWFGSGSRIIVTTTNTGLLKAHKINEVHSCEGMDNDEALSLFCKSAFEQTHPAHGYEKLSNDIVKLAGGLPLALRVYGKLLCGQEENYWKIMILKLQEYPDKEVLGRLEVVYARLESFQQKTFIYIACFLKGRSIDLVKDILKNVGLYPECGIPDLISKFLITINDEDNVWMHDLLQKMCWEILRKEREKIQKHIAIKCLKDFEHIRSEEMRTIEIINQDPYKVDGADFYIDHDSFSKTTKLKFLRVSNIRFDQSLGRLSSDLRIIEWDACSLKSLPSTFAPIHIFELEMCNSQLKTLWEKDLGLPNLRSINLSFSKDLTKLPGLKSALNLEKLILEGCTNLNKLHGSVLTLKKLRYMNLKGCIRLHTLGRSSMEMEALEALHLSGCSNLEYIPSFGQNMRSLQHLYVDGTSITKLPDNLGEMCDLRNIDVSGTCIEELPSSIHQLKRLRILYAHRCQLSFKTGFLHTNPDTLSAGLRELDLSYCNLSMVPDGIGLLCGLISLNLSGNDFIFLPASIGLLSKLRSLRLDDCKMLQSLPKLSLVEGDMDYGPRSRFTYYVSVKKFELSKVHASGNTSPTVSCLNCLKLADNESGSCLTDKIFNSYLQLRSSFWMTPEAVFEIVGAGSQIPSRFKFITSDDRIILTGPCIGVAVCVVIAGDHINAYNAATYVVTVHIHVGYKHWKVLLPVNCLVEGLENQLVLYWKADEYLERISPSEENNCRVSLNVEQGDGNLQLTKFGVHFIRDEDILQLKRHEYSTSQLVKNLFRATLYLPTELQCYICACEDDTDSNIHDPVSSMIKFVLGDGNQQDSLDGIHGIMKDLMDQLVFNECREERKHPFFFPLIYDYYRICHSISELYNDFIRLLKDTTGSWFCVKLALEQNMEKIRAGGYTYKEMLQCLNDTEAAKSVRVSDNLLILFAYICQQTVAFIGNLNKTIKKLNSQKVMANVSEIGVPGIKESNLLKVMVKVSSITVAGILVMVAKYMGDNKLLQEMKDISSYSMWLHLIQNLSRQTNKRFSVDNPHMKARFERDLCISDFNTNADLLKEMKKKLAWFNSLNSENEEHVMIVIDRLGENINKISVIVDNMCSDAQKFTIDIREAGIGLNPLISNGNLQLSKFGVRINRDEEMQQLQRDKDSAREVMKILYQAITPLPAGLPWFVCACGADTGLHLCHSIIQDATSIQIQFCAKSGEQQHSLDSIRKIFQFLYEVHLKALTITSKSRAGLKSVITETFLFYLKLSSLMKDISASWLSVKSALEQSVRKCRVDINTFGQMAGVRNSHDILDELVAHVCKKTIGFLENISRYDMVKEETEASMVFIAGMLGVFGIYMDDSDIFEELRDINMNSDGLLNLIRKYSSKWFDEYGKRMKRNNGEELQIWDYDSNAVVGELKKKMVGFDNCFTQEIGEEMVFLIDKLQMNIDYFSNSIQDMYIQATSTQIKFFTRHCEHHSLEGIRKIFQCLNEVIQKAHILIIYRSRADLRSVIRGIFSLYCELTSLMKGILDSWLRVKFTLEQSVRESRLDVYTIGQMSKPLNVYGHEAVDPLVVFDISVASVFKKTIDFLESMDNYGDMVKEETEASMVFVTGIMLGVLGIYMGDSDLLKVLSDTTLNSARLLSLTIEYSMKGGVWFDMDGKLIKRNHNREELKIWDYYGDAVVGELKKKMVVSGNCFTQEIKEDMVVLIDKLQMNIDYFSKPIQDMCTEARDKYIYTQAHDLYKYFWNSFLLKAKK